jgi:hypothetical protein
MKHEPEVSMKRSSTLALAALVLASVLAGCKSPTGGALAEGGSAGALATPIDPDPWPRTFQLDSGTTGSYQGTRSYDSSTTVTSSTTGQSKTFSSGSDDGQHYASSDGSVYKSDGSGGWQHSSGSGWGDRYGGGGGGFRR